MHGLDVTVERQPLARVPRPTVEEETSIAVIGDPHVSTRGEGGQRLPEHSEEYFRKAIADINGRDIVATVSVGDLSANGGPWDFDAIDEILADLESPFVSIPGNHDVPSTSSADHEVLPQAEFEERYAGGSVPFVREFAGVELVGLDSMRLQRNLGGEREAEQVAWLDDTLERHDVSLVLSGHKHIPGVAQTRGVWETMAPSTCTFPQGYLLVNIGPSGTDVSFVPVADRDGLEEAFLRRYTAFVKTRLYASAGAVILSSPAVDARTDDPDASP